MSSELELVISKYERTLDHLIEDSCILAYGISEKITKGLRTGIPCITFYVRKKLPLKILPTPIPSTIEVSLNASGKKLNIITDVVQLENNNEEDEYLDAYDKVRPCPGGIYVGCNKDSPFPAGMIGCWVKDNKTSKPVILTSLSIFGTSVASLKKKVYQPHAIEGDINENVIAELSNFVPIVFGGMLNGKKNSINAAVCTPVGNNIFDFSIKDVGKKTPTAIENPKVGQKVIVRGYWGLKEGFIDAVNVSFGIPGKGSSTSYKGQFTIAANDGSNFYHQGDSGSAVLDAKTHALIGIIFTSLHESKNAVASPAEIIFDLLDLSVLNPSISYEVDEKDDDSIDHILLEPGNPCGPHGALLQLAKNGHPSKTIMAFFKVEWEYQGEPKSEIIFRKLGPGDTNILGCPIPGPTLQLFQYSKYKAQYIN